VIAPAMTRTQAMAIAKRMYEGEWKIDQIRRYLATRGVSVAWSTVKVWVDPGYRDEQLRRNRVRARNAWRQRNNVQLARHTACDPEECEQTLLTLRREDKVQYTALAVIARRFYGIDLSPEQVRHRLYELGAEKNPNKARPQRRKAA
jgi:hypothetical protein